MDVVVITPRVGDLIGLPLAKAHLHVEHDDHDALIRLHIEAAAGWLDGPRGWLGLCLGVQTLRVGARGTCLAFDGLELPCGPVSAVNSITYRSPDGLDPVEVDPDLYELDANRVRRKPGAVWPAPMGEIITVTYEAGYTPATLPAAIQSAILLHLNILYEQPEDKAQAALERARDDLLSPFQQRKF